MDRVELYCTCGGHLIAESAGQEAARLVKRSFWESHSGVGHRSVTREDWEDLHSGFGYFDSYDSRVPVLAEDLIFAP